MPRAVTVQGDKRTAEHLTTIGERAGRQRPVMTNAANQVASQITGVPVDTGQLAASIEVLEATDQGFKVGTRVPYARYVFAGTRYIDAQPPRVPPNIAPRVAQAIATDIVR